MSKLHTQPANALVIPLPPPLSRNEVSAEPLVFWIRARDATGLHRLEVYDAEGEPLVHCDCTNGQKGRNCYHKGELIRGRYGSLINPKQDDLAVLGRLIDGAAAASLAREIAELERAEIDLRKRLVKFRIKYERLLRKQLKSLSNIHLPQDSHSIGES
ncbi:hypothetical protein ACETRX_36365 [Labrys portucalensis]|uniref:SWIM-type domain-containing protein n=1 Tax=Labrys neptuniae TaxID=376174 RepID=A0ABV6ZSC6_9HYPH